MRKEKFFIAVMIDQSKPEGQSKPATEAVVQRCSVKKGVLKNFGKFTGKHLCQGAFFNKIAGMSPATLLKKRLWHGVFL